MEEVFPTDGKRLCFVTGNYDWRKGNCGKVISTAYEPALGESETGAWEKDSLVRLTVTVRGEAKRIGEALTFGTLTPLPGKRVYLHLPAVCDGICLSVRALEGV